MASNRISPEEANARVLAGEPIVFLDSRSPKSWQESDRKLPGAIRVPPDDVEPHIAGLDKSSTIIAYCCCPNEESSVRVGEELGRKGFGRTFALRGGIDAWIAAGYPIERKAEAA
jgi:rhodanese-related sulfurtransferase